jgi:2-polyprenyl-6-methoxyphenol hydroxylase-like FAD-dependent oxidoreductase
MGDAAHAVHPLAGQGVNLGFADARTLFDVLRKRSKFSAIGDLPVLRRYERARRESTLALGEVTDKLRALYMSDAKAAGWVRNAGLTMLNRLPHAKAALIDYAIS